jgi:RimJ/RimL family protein N-acetyltransferase
MITTPRLHLRDFEKEDWPDVHAYTSDYEVVWRFPFGPSTEEETRRFIASVRALPKCEPRPIYDLAMALRSTNRVIGGCYLKLEGTPEPTGFIVYLLNRHYWGQGYATEAARALIEFAFRTHQAHRVFTYCEVDNAASMRVLEKAGMQREGLIRESDWIRGAWHDQYLYAILRRDWQQQESATDQ